MSIVKYYIKNGVGRVFDCNQAMCDGWGLSWFNLVSLIGIKLQDRKKPNHKVEIINAWDMMGIYMVTFKDGSCLALDNTIEQFKIRA